MVVHAADAVPLLLLTGAAVAWAPHPVAIASAIFLGCKALTLAPAWRAGVRGNVWAYTLLWPGMDPQEFFRRKGAFAPAAEWGFALAKTMLGVALLLFGFPLVGLAFLLLFGLAHVSALAWRMQPIFRWPILARSAGELWGARWNLAFHQVAYAFVYRPLRRRLGAKGAMTLVFVISGVVHDLILSVPAGRGYGLPTLYFLIQGAAVAARLKGRCVTALVALGPLPLLFHTPILELLR